MSEYILVNHGGSANHGCEALARTANALLQGRNIVMSEAPKEDLYYGLNDVIAVCPARSSYSKTSLDFISAYAKLKFQRDYSYMDVLPYLQPIRSIDDKAIIISIGGDVYCYEDYKKYILIHRELAKKHKTILLGCSLEKELFHDPEFVKDMGSYSYISARESLTYGYLRDAGFTNIGMAPDTAFALLSIRLPLPEGFIENNTIGINISPLVERKGNKTDIVKENYRNLIEYILKNTDSAIALIPHVVWKGNDDRTILKELYNEYKDSGRLVLVEDHNCMELKGFIERCRIFVGARTHATIAAYSSYVPTLVVGYSVKSKGIATDLFGNDENYVVPVQSFAEANDLTKRFIWVMSHENDIKAHLQGVMPKYVAGIDPLSVVLRRKEEK